MYNQLVVIKSRTFIQTTWLAVAIMAGGSLQAADCLPPLGNGQVCSAKDLVVDSVNISGPSACTEGEVIDVTFEFVIGGSANADSRAANERYSIGFYIGDLGGPVIEGNSCTFSSLSPLEPPLDLAGGSGGYRDLNDDACGDILGADSTVHHVFSDQVLCKDGDGDGRLDLDFAVTWESNKNVACTDPDDEANFIPPTPSSCLLQPEFDYDIIVESPPELLLLKSAFPRQVTAPAEAVTYSVLLFNRSDNTDSLVIDSLVDDIYGDLNGQGSCSTPQELSPGSVYLCRFTKVVSGSPGEIIVDTITAEGTDDEGSPISAVDIAQVVISTNFELTESVEVTKYAFPSEIDEPGGRVTYSVAVQNTGETALTLNVLDDDIYGPLDGKGNCSLPQVLPVDSAYYCSFSEDITGEPGSVITDTIYAADESGENPVSDTDSASVSILDLPSRISVQKHANPTFLPEPGGTVEYRVDVLNTSLADTVTINTLTDSRFGDLNGQGDCFVPQTLTPGSVYECNFSADDFGQPGDIIFNTVTAFGIDDDNLAVSGKGGSFVSIFDLPASFTVSKSASPETLAAPGGDVTFSINVTNTSEVDAITLTSLVDVPYGDLNGQGDCITPQPDIPPGGSYSCQFTQNIDGVSGDVFVDTVTAGAQDDDLNVLPLARAQAQVTLGAPQLSLKVTKLAYPISLNEPGGPVTFFLRVRNTSTVDLTITSLQDDIYLDLNGQGSCATGTLLAPGAVYTCSFSADLQGQPGEIETDTISVVADAGENGSVQAEDSATVTITDLPSGITLIKTPSPTFVTEPGGTVEFTVSTLNTSQADVVTLESLVDNVHGNINGQGDCLLPRQILPGESWDCTFPADITGLWPGDEVDTIVATGTDDDGDTVTAQASATVTILSAPATLSVHKRPSKYIVEPGATVTFSVEVENTSTYQDLELLKLIDDKYGNLDGQGNCSLPQNIEVGATYTCAFDGIVDGSAPGFHRNQITAFAGVAGDLDTRSSFISGQAHALVILVMPGGFAVFTAPIPALSDIALAALAGLLMLIAVYSLRRHRRSRQ